jgi:hypothetical protein
MDPLARLLGSYARLKLLRLFLFNDDTSFGTTDLAFRTKTPKDVLRKELNILVASGVIRKKAPKGSGVTYIASKKFPHYEALQAFVRGTTNLGDTDMVTALKKSGTLRMVVLSGLFTGAEEPKIDLLIVGDKLEQKPLDSAMHALEADLGREIRYAVFATEDFTYRRGVYDRLLRDVFDFPHRVIHDRLGA